jgi:type I restriction enzyme S subunit
MMERLPPGWFSARISELCHVVKEKGREGVVPYLEIGNVDVSSKTYSLTRKPSVKGCRLARKSDVLISKVRPTRGAITRIQESELQVSSAFTVLRSKGALAEQCLWLFLAWNREYLNHLGDNCSGTMYPTTSDEAVVDFKMPIPPLAEQERFVAKLAMLLSKVDTCRQRLAKIPTILRRFRQSVLVAACSGRLTADWRSTNSSDGGDTAASSNLAEFTASNVPERWSVETLHDCCLRIIDGNYGGDYPTQEEFITCGVPFLTSAAIGDDGKIIDKEVRYISPKKHSILRKAQTTIGDVLFTNRGARVGATAMLIHPRYLVSNIGPQVTRLAANPEKCSGQYLLLWMRTPSFLAAMKERNGGSAMNFLNLTVTKGLPINVPPIAEQHEIVRRVEALFAFADRLTARFEKARAHVDKLTPALIAKAFRGELVPQDPNEEPASALLERTRMEKWDDLGAKPAKSVKAIQRRRAVASVASSVSA